MPDTKSTSKRDRILAGLRDLCAEQHPGQSYTADAIARRCGCSKPNIEQIERKAIERVRRRFRKIAAEFGVALPRGVLNAPR